MTKLGDMAICAKLNSNGTRVKRQHSHHDTRRTLLCRFSFRLRSLARETDATKHNIAATAITDRTSSLPPLFVPLHEARPVPESDYGAYFLSERRRHPTQRVHFLLHVALPVTFHPALNAISLAVPK
jgi:hypothetical protein